MQTRHFIYIIIGISIGCLCAGWLGGYLFGHRQYNIQYRTIRELEQQLTDQQSAITEYNRQASDIVNSMGQQLATDAVTISDIKRQLINLREKIKALQDIYANNDYSVNSSNGISDVEDN